jgi:diguanylate cyclase (GGDEF)-like protein
MKRILHRITSWWFATMVPIYSEPTNIGQREAIRKRRLFSVLILVTLTMVLSFLLVELIAHVKGVQVGPPAMGSVTLLLTLWINQCGYLKSASLFFLLSQFLSIVAVISNLSLSLPLFSFCLWTILPILLVMCALLLPAWGSFLLGSIEMLYMGWFVFGQRHEQIATYLRTPGEQVLFLALVCVILSLITIFCALCAATTQRAVIQADRAEEVEQAHQALSVLHSDLEIAHASIQMQALTDGLTNLPNHRAVMEQFAKEIERARRHHLAFSILFFDADHFKRVNDTYGHGAGDAVLRQIGERASSCLRLGDTLGRFGGEEFVILLFEADASGASTVAERIRATVAAEPMAHAEVEGGIAMTVSIGQATYIEDGQNEQELLAQADQAMYVAKRMGRNQVRSATEARQLSADPAQAALWDKLLASLPL